MLVDVQYLRFGREIQSIAENLQQLENVIKHANSQRPRRPWGRDDECCVPLQPVAHAVGDFKKTLEECEGLLADNERFQRDSAGFIDNVVWHLSTQQDVDILRERVHFHSTKVLFSSLQRLHLKLTGIAPDFDETVRNVSHTGHCARISLAKFVKTTPPRDPSRTAGVERRHL